MAKYLDGTGVTYLWSQMKSWVTTHIKLTSVTSGGVTTNTLSIGNDDVDIPNSTSQLINDSGFITSADVPEGAAASTTTPKMNGTAAVGTETAFARGDHIHPSDTSKVSTSTTVNGHALTGNVTVTKSDLSLDNVENKSSATIRGEITSSNVTTALGFTPVNSVVIGAANGVCPLDSTSKISSQYLPSYVDDVIEAYIRTGQTALSSTWLATGSASGSAITPETGKIYIIMNGTDTYPTGSQYRWGGSAYVKLNDGGVSALTNTEIDAAIAAAD